MSNLSVFEKIAATEERNIRLYRHAKVRYGLLFGFLGGLVFALAAWGIDAVRLANAHAILPWGKLLIGGIPCVLLGALIGWLSLKIERVAVNALLWGMTGLAFAWFVGYSPFRGATSLLESVDSSVTPLVQYTVSNNLQGRIQFISIIISITFILASILLFHFIEVSSTASRWLERLWPIVAWSLFFAIAGLAADTLLHGRLRTPLIVTDDTIQFILDHKNNHIDGTVARAMHLRALDPVKELLHQPRRLILADYDDTIVQVNVLIDFDGTWVRCSMLDNQLGVCKLLE